MEASTNPFAKVVLAHLKARETHENPVDRQSWKSRLVRGLYERGFGEKDVVALFRLIDWMMELPPVLDKLFWEEVDKTQEERKMPFITTPQRIGLREGIRMGIEAVLHVRFGEVDLQLLPEIDEVHHEDQLKAILKDLKTGAILDEVRGMCKSTGT